MANSERPLSVTTSDSVWVPQRGRHYVHIASSAPPAINATQGRSDRERAMEITATLNTRKYIEDHFTRRHDGTLLIETIDDVTGFVQIPTGQYSSGGSIMGGMVNMREIPEQRSPGEIIEAQSTFNLDLFEHHEQRRYWESGVSMLRVLDSIAQERNKVDPGRWRAYLVQNEMKNVTGAIATSRTMCFPHFQVFLFDTWHVDPSQDPYSLNVLKLNKERTYLDVEFFQTVLTTVLDHSKVPDQLRNRIRDKIVVHTQPPYGYGFTLDASIHPDEFALVMRLNHQLYLELGNTLIKTRKESVQRWIAAHHIAHPSYRIIGRIVHEEGSSIDGTIEMVFSPEYLSNGGPLEKMGIWVNRSPNNTEQITPDEYQKLCQAAIEPLIEQGMKRRRAFSMRSLDFKHQIIHPYSGYIYDSHAHSPRS